MRCLLGANECEGAPAGTVLEGAYATFIFASRTILLGVVLVALAIRRKREGLAWVLSADAALQVFDTGMALATNKGAVAVLPIALGALDVWAGLHLLRATRRSNPPAE